MNILVENVSSSASDHDIRKLFSAYGAVESVRMVQDKHTGIQNGQAYVSMASSDEGERAIASLNGMDFEGQCIRVRQADDAEFPSGSFW